MVTESPDTAKGVVPAYVSFPTFENFVEGFCGETVDLPDHIDKSLMPTMSGGTQNHLIASLKFLGLMLNDGETSDEFHELVRKRRDGQWKEALRELINTSYKGVVNTDSVSKLTPKKLRDSFCDAGTTGSTTGRAIRFYLSALKSCGVDVPKHLSKGSTSTARKKSANDEKPAKSVRRRRPSSDPPKSEDRSHPGGDVLKGMIPIPIPRPDDPSRVMYVPSDVDEADCEMITTIVGAIAARMKGK